MNPVGQSLFLSALGWALLNSLWQMAAVWLMYFMITAGGKRFTANTRYKFGFLAVLLGMAGFIFSFIHDYLHALPFAVFNNANLSGLTVFSSFRWLAYARQIILSGLPYFSTIYLIVLLIQSGRYLSYYYHSRRLSLTGKYEAPDIYRHFVANACVQLGIRKKVSLWLSAVAESPMTAGFLKSVILVPLATINHLTTAQVEAILVHELAHIRRNDYLLNLALTAMGILFFFNPFARLMICQVRKEAENSCDDLVMQFQYDPHTYISALLSLENARPRHHFALAAAGKDHRALLQRVKRIAGQYEQGRYQGKKTCIGFLMFLASFFAASFIPAYRSLHKSADHAFAFSALKIADKERAVTYRIAVAPVIKKSALMANVLPLKKVRNIHFGKSDANSVTSVNITGTDEAALDADNAILTLQADAEKDFSILQTDRIPPPATAGTPSAYALPYVPQASFDYKMTVDSGGINEADELTYEQKMDRDNLQKALIVIDGMDWKKVGNAVKTARGKSGQKKLQFQINQSLAVIDWQKANTRLLNNEEELRLKENIRLRLLSLNRPLNQFQQTLQIQQYPVQEHKKLNQVFIIKRQPQAKRRKTVYI